MPTRRARPDAVGAVLVIAGIVIALVALTVVIKREGPDRTVVGVVSVLEEHRICVGPPGSSATCAHVDAPTMTEGVQRDECIRLRRSAQGDFVSAHRARECT
jgi:hypothetical protein